MRNFFKPSANKCCDNCKHFWLAANPDGSPTSWGFCHKRPPQVIPDLHGEAGQCISAFPSVMCTSHCDEGVFNNPEKCSVRAGRQWEAEIERKLEQAGVEKREFEKLVKDLTDASIRLPLEAAIKIALHRAKGDDVFYGGTPPDKLKDLPLEDRKKESMAIADRINQKLGIKRPAPVATDMNGETPNA